MDGETCTFWWTRESANSVTAFSNTVGWCFKFGAFRYDSNGDMTLDAPYPRCRRAWWRPCHPHRESCSIASTAGADRPR